VVSHENIRATATFQKDAGMMTTMKLLIVEDNERVAQFLIKGLRESGHDVDHAGNGRDGMLLATSAAYDAIIMDRMLPGGIDGLGVVEA